MHGLVSAGTHQMAKGVRSSDIIDVYFRSRLAGVAFVSDWL
jgi:hypothetical protein